MVLNTHPLTIMAYAAVFVGLCALVVAVSVAVIAQRMKGNAYAYERFGEEDKKKDGLMKELDRKMKEMKEIR